MSTQILSTIIAIVVVVAALATLLVVSLMRRRNKSSDEQENNEQVYVGNLAYRIGERDLAEHFEQFGSVVQARIIKNTRTGRSKGFGFITFSNTQQAQNALAAHGEDFNGRTLVVRIAKPR